MFGAPPNLPGQLAALIDTLNSVRDELAGLRSWFEGQARDPEQTPIPIAISSRDQNGGVYADDRQLNIKKLWISTTLSGRYSLKLGNDSSSVPFIAQANVTLDVDVPGLTVARGLPITLSPFPAGSGGPAGTPTWDVVLWCTPGTAAGRSS